MHTHMHTCINTCIARCMHGYIHPYIYACMYAYIRSYIHKREKHTPLDRNRNMMVFLQGNYEQRQNLQCIADAPCYEWSDREASIFIKILISHLTSLCGTPRYPIIYSKGMMLTMHKQAKDSVKLPKVNSSKLQHVSSFNMALGANSLENNRHRQANLLIYCIYKGEVVCVPTRQNS